MNRIALLGDIHANLPALQTVLEHAAAQGCDAVWNVGDAVGYGPFPEPVVRLLIDRQILSLQGNYDRKVTQVPAKAEKWARTKAPEKWFAFRWAYEHLSPESLAYLAALPLQSRQAAGSFEILLVHGSPASQDEHLTPQTSPDRFAELAALARADIVVCGHSHQPFARRYGDTLFINTGSVGRPDDGDWRTGYALLDLSRAAPRVQHFRLSYPLQVTLDAMRAGNFPPRFIEMIRQGRNLDDIAAQEDA